MNLDFATHLPLLKKKRLLSFNYKNCEYQMTTKILVCIILLLYISKIFYFIIFFNIVSPTLISCGH